MTDRFPCPHTGDICQRGDCPATACVLDLDTRPIVYVAGPYQSPDPIANTRRAITVGAAMLDDDGIPFEGIVWGVLLSIPMWVVAGVFTWLLLRRR